MADDGTEATDPMERVPVPLAAVPALPVPPNLAGLKDVPTFGEYVAELKESKDLGWQLGDMATTGQRLIHAATAKLLCGDCEAAKEDLKAVEELPTPREVIGTLWDDRVRRFHISNRVSWHIQNHISCLTLLSFLEKGVLTPEMPERCRVGISDVDDERYLLGIIETLGELERYSVNRAQNLDLRSLRLFLEALQCLEQALMQFDFRNSDLRRRFDGVKYSVRRLENYVYEVDLAIQRSAAAEAAGQVAQAADVAQSVGDSPPGEPAKEGVAEAITDAAEAVLPPAPARALDLKLLAEIKQRFDAFDARREVALKRSRDVVKAAKNAIYALQRADFRKADADIRQSTKEAESIHREVVDGFPALRGSLFSAGLEELCEAITYRAFRKDRRLLSKAELQAASGLSFDISLQEYLGGIMDLTGEVGRYAIRSAAKGRQAIPEVELCRALVAAVQAGVQELPYLPGGLGKKSGGLKIQLQKMDGALYELALLTRGGLRVQAPTFRAEEEEGGQHEAAGHQDAGDSY